MLLKEKIIRAFFKWSHQKEIFLLATRRVVLAHEGVL